MTKKAVLYARVSTERQDADDKVSIDQQLADMKALCERQGWQIMGVFVDKERYLKTKPPYKGKVREPSGEYDDRPQFLEMLKVIEAGQIDVIVYWDSYRFGRHYRVIGSFMTSLEIGDKLRNGKGEIEIWEASKNSPITRMLLGIMTSIGKEENDTRKRRSKMGKVGTLKQGRWPASYKRFGYRDVKELGKRGVKIELEDSEAQTVKNIFNLYDAGKTGKEIRLILLAESTKQKDLPSKRHEWSPAIISRILTCQDYTGKAVFRFEDGTEYTIDIPQIITPEQFERVQKKIKRNSTLSKRNAKGVYLLHNIAFCQCGSRIGVMRYQYYYKVLANGTRKRYEYQTPKYVYHCFRGHRYPFEPHPNPKNWDGVILDNNVWRCVADNVIKNPDLILERVQAKQTELQQQGNNFDGEIAKAKRKLTEIETERAFYQRQAGKGNITESEFETRMAETEASRQYWLEQLEHLIELRDNAAKVQTALDYAYELLTSINRELPQIDHSLEELLELPQDKQELIWLKRQNIIRALAEKIIIFANGEIEIQGLLDGSEGLEIGLVESIIQSLQEPT